MTATSVTFKFIGYQNDSSNDFVHDFGQDEISKKDIYLVFMRLGMNIEHLKKIKFISKGNCINDLDKKYNVEPISPIYIFSNESIIQTDLLKFVFTNIKEKPKPSVPSAPSAPSAPLGNPPSFSSINLSLSNFLLKTQDYQRWQKLHFVFFLRWMQ